MSVARDIALVAAVVGAQDRRLVAVREREAVEAEVVEKRSVAKR